MDLSLMTSGLVKQKMNEMCVLVRIPGKTHLCRPLKCVKYEIPNGCCMMRMNPTVLVLFFYSTVL
jgi:hypothetical protein